MISRIVMIDQVLIVFTPMDENRGGSHKSGIQEEEDEEQLSK